MRIAAVVILYHPEEKVLSNINSYTNEVEKIYVFDNTEQGTNLKEQLLRNQKFACYHDGENKGIAKRLNAAANQAIADGFDWLLLMDQDSSFAESMIRNYFLYFNEYKSKTDVAMFGVNFEQQTASKSLSCNAVLSDELITSGTLLNLDLFQKIGDFDEKLFIDAVDHEYTIKTLFAGYKIIQFSNIKLTHQIGTLLKRASIKTLFLVRKEKKIHSALRCYYVYRNNLYMQKKYKNTNVVSMQKLNKIAMSIINTSLFYGRNSLKLIYYIYHAKRDFRSNKMGKY